MARKLYDLAGARDGLRFSPYCWRIKMALKHKGLDWEEIPWRFTEKNVIAFAGSTTVPVLVDGDTVIADSWNIARHLESKYPPAPLFGGPQAEAHALFIKLWCEQTLNPQILRLIVMDLFARIHPKDKGYFRSSREARFGKPLEAFVVPPEEGLPPFRASLGPARATLEKQPFLGGESPSFADYCLFGVFQWARAMSPIELLEPGDGVHAWRARLLAAFDGFASRLDAARAPGAGSMPG